MRQRRVLPVLAVIRFLIVFAIPAISSSTTTTADVSATDVPDPVNHAPTNSVTQSPSSLGSHAEWWNIADGNFFTYSVINDDLNVTFPAVSGGSVQSQIFWCTFGNGDPIDLLDGANGAYLGTYWGGPQGQQGIYTTDPTDVVRLSIAADNARGVAEFWRVVTVVPEAWSAAQGSAALAVLLGLARVRSAALAESRTLR